jgi:predicted nuclease of restriction endonuclease-like (RecB) superfamily
MRAFAEAYPNGKFVHQAGGQIHWKYHRLLLDGVKDPEQRLWYSRETVNNGWSRAVLEMQIESSLYQRQGAVTNFENTLPNLQSDLAQYMMWRRI